MRIIGGELRGRHIAAPDGEGTRPMLDRVREAVFSTLAERVTDAVVLDLFAGSGALGLESASRGAASVRSVERSARALSVLKRNVADLGLADRVRVVRNDALDPRSWHDAGAVRAPYGLVFLDPPYPLVDDPAERSRILAAIRALFETELTREAILVLHVASRASEWLRFGAGFEHDTRIYGGSAIVYLTRASNAADGAS